MFINNQSARLEMRKSLVQSDTFFAKISRLRRLHINYECCQLSESDASYGIAAVVQYIFVQFHMPLQCMGAKAMHEQDVIDVSVGAFYAVKQGAQFP